MTLRPTHQHTRAAQYRQPGGAWEVPTLDDLLASRSVAGGPDIVALVDGDVRLTFGDLDQLAGRLAGGLHAAGVRRRDAVAWQLKNGYESALLLRACWRLGAVAVPIHDRADAAGVDRILHAVSPQVVVGAAGLPLSRRPDAFVIGGARLPSRSSRASDHAIPHLTHQPAQDFAKLLAAEPVDADRARPSDLAVVLFTPGAAREAKGVLHTHRTLACKARLMTQVHCLTAHDAVLVPTTLAHISGLLNGILVPGIAGMKSVLMSRWNPELALALIESERVTSMAGPPSFFLGLMESRDFSPRRTRTLRLVSLEGSGISPGFVERSERELGSAVRRTYGSTEAPSVVATGADDHDDDAVAASEAELRVVDPDTGKDQPLGREGELWLRGPEICAGYVDPAQTDAAFARGGWFRTGDLAILDPHLGLTITGRLEDVIIRDGERISAAEVESVLEQHPAVRAAAVIGYPDERLGERVAAFIVARELFDLAACRHWFAQRGVAKSKWPEHVQTVLSMPTLPSGKVDRHELRTFLPHT